MCFPYKRKKAIQASVLLLKEDPQCKEDKIRLVKLLYIAERESLKEIGDPITDDEVYAMPHGPAGTKVVDELGKNWEWQDYIKAEGEHGLRLVKNPETDRLSKYEIEKLKEVAQRRKDDKTWEIVDGTHYFDEYVKNDPHHDPDKDSKPIPFEDLLEALDLAEFKDEYREIRAEYKAMREILQS